MKCEQKPFKFISSARPNVMYTSHAQNMQESLCVIHTVYGVGDACFTSYVFLIICEQDICMRFHIHVNIFMFIRVGYNIILHYICYACILYTSHTYTHKRMALHFVFCCCRLLFIHAILLKLAERKIPNQHLCRHL